MAEALEATTLLLAIKEGPNIEPKTVWAFLVDCKQRWGLRSKSDEIEARMCEN